MPRFIYEALDPKGRVVQGVIDAPSKEEVVRDLKNINFTVTSIRPQLQLTAGLKDLTTRFQKVSTHTLALFTRQFATIFNAGIPLLYGLEGMSNPVQTGNRKLAEVVRHVYNDVKGGYSLSKALSKHPEVFSVVYISLVRAGEVSGALGDILERLAEFLEKEYLMRKKVIAAMIYPLVVFVFALLTAIFLVTYIFPSFVQLFEGLDVELPLTTRILIFVTNFLKSPLFISLSGFGLLVLIYVLQKYVRTSTGRKQVDYLLLEMPVAGQLFRKIAVARFCRNLGTLLGSGVTIIKALEVVEKITGNEVFAETVADFRTHLRAGRRLSQLLKEYPIFPPMAAQMVSVGEESGNLPLILQKIAYFYELEIDNLLTSLTTMLEPILIGAMGIMVGFILLGIFQPIYGLLQRF